MRTCDSSWKISWAGRSIAATPRSRSPCKECVNAVASSRRSATGCPCAARRVERQKGRRRSSEEGPLGWKEKERRKNGDCSWCGGKRKRNCANIKCSSRGSCTSYKCNPFITSESNILTSIHVRVHPVNFLTRFKKLCDFLQIHLKMRP